MLLSQKRLVQILGVLWLIDGLLQLQPNMFTMDMVNGVMEPTLQSQPAPVESSLNFIINTTIAHLTLVNLIIAVVQIILGLCLLIGSRRYPNSSLVKGAVIVSVFWALIVWYGGEGMSMLLTGQASILTGAPGAVLLYPLLGFVVYPRQGQSAQGEPEGIVSRKQLRWGLAAFWFLSALLQLQPFWWQQGQISQAVGGMSGQGGLDGVLVDPLVNGLSNITGSAEVPLNIILILLFVALGVGLLLVNDAQVRPLLVVSIVLSAIVWWGAQGFGMIFTGMATDFNSGLLLILIALACWPRAKQVAAARRAQVAERSPAEQSTQTA